ncbi:MAG: glutathione S-transferase family protein [Ahrensia sp.]|nr:glutathione S-transferase family protein [Ahrensia sp.]
MTIKLYELCAADDQLVFSPHCWKIRMALAHKGLVYESVPVRFSQVSKIQNGEGRLVPVLVDDNKVIEDSFAIALHLEEKYSDRPTLFGGEGGIAAARFVESWSFTQVHPVITRMVFMKIFHSLKPEDQAHFRITREKRFGMTLEAFAAAHATTIGDVQNALTPLEVMLAKQAFIGGQTPLFSDYIVFGAIQWLRVFHGEPVMKEGSKTASWVETMLDLHGAVARKAKLAA